MCGIQFQDSAVICSKSGKIVREKNDRFVSENAIWLEQKEVLPVHVSVHEEESNRNTVECASSSQGQGRPRNTFDQ
jgi:hypothetical protein